MSFETNFRRSALQAYTYSIHFCFTDHESVAHLSSSSIFHTKICAAREGNIFAQRKKKLSNLSRNDFFCNGRMIFPRRRGIDSLSKENWKFSFQRVAFDEKSFISFHRIVSVPEKKAVVRALNWYQYTVSSMELSRKKRWLKRLFRNWRYWITN